MPRTGNTIIWNEWFDANAPQARPQQQSLPADPTACRRCGSPTGGTTGLSRCPDTRICYLASDDGERAHGCHFHFVCWRCTSRARIARRSSAPVTHCSEYSAQCDTCRNCDEFCVCAHCSRCRGRADDLCPDCGRCDQCGCACDEDPIHPRPPHIRRTGDKFHTATRKQRRENPSERYISVEIEVCGIKKPGTGIEAVVRKWGGAIVGDGSLPEGGFEINTAPANGDLYLKQISEICAELEKAGAWTDEQAGMHCHVDARDLRYYDMRRVVKLYAHMEPALYRLCGVHRRLSHFCRPCGATLSKSLKSALTPKASKKALLRNVYGQPVSGRRFKAVKATKHNDKRYAALNLHSWVYRGSLECRMYHGTTRAHSAISWGMLWAGLVDYAAKASEREIDALIAEKNGRDCLLVCAPTDAVREWMRSRWNFLSRAHDEQDAADQNEAAYRQQTEQANIIMQRQQHAQTMRQIASYLDSQAGRVRLSSPPEWAVDWREDEQHTYAWIDQAELHRDVFGED